MSLIADRRFELATQQLHNWCWASVSAGIHNYLADSGDLTQCEVAGVILSQSCCVDPSAFNQQHSLTDALNSALGKLAWSAERVLHPLGFEDIEREIDAGRPICARIVWSGNLGAHFNVIYGYRISDEGRKQIFVSDPFYVDSVIDYDFFVHRYQDEGTWESTYLLHKHS